MQVTLVLLSGFRLLHFVLIMAVLSQQAGGPGWCSPVGHRLTGVPSFRALVVVAVLSKHCSYIGCFKPSSL